MHFFFVQTLHGALHDLSGWVVVALVLGSVGAVYVFYRLFEADLFGPD
jgi:hypothetical protein